MIRVMLAGIAGMFLGAGVTAAFYAFKIRLTDKLARELFAKGEEQLKESFKSLSFDALSQANEQLLTLAQTRLAAEREGGAKDLESAKALIAEQLSGVAKGVERMSDLVTAFERDREQKFGALQTHLQQVGKQTGDLLTVTNTLREALASTRVRGQWGERMAEDVLRLAGFKENVNYVKQKAIEQVGSRPDFTFFLPRQLKLNMDVKFPYDNYLRYLEAAHDGDRARYRTDFLRDVRAKIKEVTTREYIAPERDTVDYVLLFIPNEQIYGFIHEQDSAVLDEGIRHKVIFCSPITLFAVLAVVRQAVDNFALEKTSNQILAGLGEFRKQWTLFLSRLESLGKKIETVQKEYEHLITTRKQMLERPLNKVEQLREQAATFGAEKDAPVGEIDTFPEEAG